MVRRLRFFTIGYFVLLGLMVASVLPFALFTVHTVNGRINELLPAQRAASSLLTSAVDQETSERGYVITGNVTFLGPYESGREAASADIAAINRLHLSSRERAATALAAADLERWRQTAAAPEIAATAAGNRPAAVARVAGGSGKRLFDSFRADQTHLSDLIDARVQRSNDDLRNYSTFVIIALAFATVIGTVLALLFRRWARRVAVEADARNRALADAAALTQSVIEAAADPIFAKDLEGRYVISNSATAHALGTTPVGLDGHAPEQLVDASVAAVLRADDERVIATGLEESFDEIIDTPEGERHFISRKAPLRDAAGKIVGVVGVARDMTDEFAAAAALARAARVQETIAAVTAAMATGRTVSEVAHAAVEGAAESTSAPFGSLRLMDEATGQWQFVAMHGVVEELNREWQPYAEDMPAPLRIVVRTRRTLTVTKDDFARHYPDIVDTTSALGVDTIVYVPVFHAGAVSAVVTLGLGPEQGHMAVDAKSILEALAPIIGQALERARLFEANRSVAVTLQRALLEHAPLDDDRVAVAARYRPATEDALVGGDWYDVVTLRRDRVALIVGDVVGHGVDAAAAMGQLRSALTALVGAVDNLSAAVEYFEREARRNPAGISATCLVLVLDPVEQEIQYVSVGHPPALLLLPDGETVYLDEFQGPPLAISPIDRRRPIGRHAFPVGSTILLYTDGLVERRQVSIDVGFERLRAAADGCRSASVDEMCEEVLEQLLGSYRNQDDIALVAARLQQADSRHFTRHLSDDLKAIATIRHELRRFLDRCAVAPELRDSILVGASEALTNSFEHAYPVAGGGAIVLDAVCREDQVEITVRDHGKWRTPGNSPFRGRGLLIMRELADDLVMRTHPTGTSLTLVYRVTTDERSVG